MKQSDILKKLEGRIIKTASFTIYGDIVLQTHDGEYVRIEAYNLLQKGPRLEVHAD
jgi:hypothetical protein